MRSFPLILLKLVIIGISWLPAEVDAQDLVKGREVTVPILLYHNITKENSSKNRYVVAEEDFSAQMERLKYWGYSSITIEDLVDHLNKGHPLPHRPVVISFDDGYLEVYENAFPIMERYGFFGTVYIVANRLHSDGFLQEDELKVLLDNGWEVGSHGMSHTELTQNHELVRDEILQSRLDIEDALGIKIYSFAYPFGTSDWYVLNKVLDYGYRAAVGVGNISKHSNGTVYNLSRREIQGGFDLDAFAALFPWTNYFVPSPVRKYVPE